MTREESLQFFQKLIFCGHSLYFWSYDVNWELIATSCPAREPLDMFFRMNRPEIPEDTSRPLVIAGSLGLMWIADFQKKDGAVGQIHVIGPVFTEDVALQNLEANLRALRLPDDVRRGFLAILNDIPIFTVTRFFEYGIMLHYCLTEEYLACSDFQVPAAERKELDIPLAPSDTHATWAMEQQLLKLIEDGNLQYKEQSARLVNMGDTALLGNGDPIRNLKNITIIYTALCTRAAIRGGLPPEIAYSLSDMYIQSIESSHSFGEIAEVNDAMVDDFVRRVHQCRTRPERSAQTEKCCYYIQTHLTEKITVKSLADYAGYTETYLSRKFKTEMGMSVTEYVTQQKTELAKKLLREGKLSVSDIAEMLCFGTQSYFSEQFRKVTGQTPGEYRRGQA
jgi:AraC-like DNA-binding protein